MERIELFKCAASCQCQFNRARRTSATDDKRGIGGDGTASCADARLVQGDEHRQSGRHTPHRD